MESNPDSPKSIDGVPDMSAEKIAIISQHLNGQGQVIYDEATKAGIDVALACAIVEQESGGQNIFGCDFGDVGDTPPYCRQPVTPQRVAALRTGGTYDHGMNGIGLTQITWWEFVDRGEALGGIHLPWVQCKVGFDLIAHYLSKNEYMWALELYNGDDGKPGSPYANAVAAKHAKWKERLAVPAHVPAPPPPIQNGDEHPTVWGVKNDKGWGIKDGSGEFLRAKNRPNTAWAADPSGWLYPESPGVRIPGPAAKRGTWLDRHPTRYNFRRDLADLNRSIEAQYVCSINTYVDHPEGWGKYYGINLDPLSCDYWDKAGRGVAINPAIGDAIVDRIMDDPNPPYVWWIIWQGWIWIYEDGFWKPFKDDGTGLHYDHVHLTIRKSK